MPMDFINIVALGPFEKIQRFLLNTLATFKNGLPQKWVPGGGNCQICIVMFLSSMLCVHLSFQKNQWV